MANPQCEHGYTRLANELLEALCRARLSGREMRVVLAIVRLTYGFNVKMGPVSLGRISSLTGISRRHVCGLLRTLEKKGIVSRQRQKGRIIVGLQKDYQRWVFPNSGVPRFGNSQIREPRKRERSVPESGNKVFPNPGTSVTGNARPPRDSQDPKDIYKDTSKDIIYGEDDQREIVQAWERAFGTPFPTPREKADIRAADYMLWLRGSSRLPDLRNPVAYLRKLAGRTQTFEDFPPYAERVAKAKEAEEAARRRAEREAEMALERLKWSELLEAETEARWLAMGPEERRELMEIAKLVWPGKPIGFIERQAKRLLRQQIKREMEEQCRLMQ